MFTVRVKWVASNITEFPLFNFSIGENVFKLGVQKHIRRANVL